MIKYLYNKKVKRRTYMKLKRSLSFLILLAVLITALPVYAFASFSGPAISDIETKLTGEDEGLVYFSDFEGLELTPANKQGTQNATLTVSGCTEKTGPYYNSRYVRDYWVSDGYRNLYTDGHQIFWRAHDKNFVTPGTGNDDNNNVQIDFKNAPLGADMVFSFDIALYAEQISSSFSFYFISNYATEQLKIFPFYVTADGCIRAGSNNSSPLILDPEIGKMSTITTHIRVIDPNPEVAGDVGKILMDIYVDGVLVIEGRDFLSAEKIKKISKVTYNSSTENAKSPENNTGISSDFRPSYLRLAHSSGTLKAKDASGNSLGANGQDILGLDNIKIYFSDECYEKKNTVTDASLSYGANGCDINFDLLLDEAFVKNEGAKVRFTDSEGNLQEKSVNGKRADENGLYSFKFTLAQDCYQNPFTLQLVNGDGTVRPLYKDGVSATAYTNTLANLEKEVYSFGATIEEVYGAKKAIVSLTFDDAIYSTALVVEELCEKYGIPASMMLWCSHLVDSGMTYADAQTWAKLFEKGYLEPQNHSMTHMKFNADGAAENFTEENYINEIVSSKELLESYFPEYDFITFAIPFGSMCDDAMALAAETYFASRGVSSARVQSLDPGFGTGNGTWNKLYSPGVVKKDADGNLVSAEEQLEYLKGWIDRTVSEGGWYVPFIHRIGDVSGTEMTYEVADKYFAYIDSYQESGDIWVATFSNAVKYVRERQNTKASVRYELGNIYLTLNMAQTTADGHTIDKEVFDHPLTVKVEVPDTFNEVYYKLGTEIKMARAFREGNSTYAYVDAIPDGKEVEIVGTHEFTKYEKIDENTHEKVCNCGFSFAEAHTYGEYGYCKLCEVGISGVSLALDSDLAIRYYVNISDKALLDGGNIKMEFTADGKAVSVTDYEIKDGLFVFTYDGIGPHRIDLAVDARLMLGEETLDEKRDFSAEKYCLEALEIYEYDEELVALIDSLVLYSKAAAEYMGLDASALFTDYEPGVSAIAPTKEDDALLIDGNDADDLYIYSLGVHFDSVNRIYAKIYSADEGFSVTFNQTAVDKEDIVSLGNGFYLVYSEPTAPTLFGAEGLKTIELFDGENELKASVEYTVNTYAYYMVTSDGTSLKMKALAEALYLYGECAKAYAQKTVI